VQPRFELMHVDAHYGKLQALFDVSVQAADNGITAVLGPNGAGKTSCLRLAAGLLAPTSGEVRFQGNDITRRRPGKRAAAGICLIPEGRGIFPDLTVRENIRLQTFVRHIGTREIEELVLAAFPRLGSHLNQQAGTLSGGEQQMLALSRGITTEPKVLLIDEPSMGLAPVIVEELFEIIHSIAARGQTVILAEQLAEQALDIADHAVVLSHGSIVSSGNPEDVRKSLTEAYMGPTAVSKSQPQEDE
jgi:branched-chain amino acid transport system ATP-binding protein